MAEHKTSLKSIYDISEKIRQSVEKTAVSQEKVTETVNRGTKVRKEQNTLLKKALSTRNGIVAQATKSNISASKNLALSKAILGIKIKQLSVDKAKSMAVIAEQKKYISTGVRINDSLRKQSAIQSGLRVKTALQNASIQKFQARQKANLTGIISLQKMRNQQLLRTLSSSRKVNTAGKQTVRNVSKIKKESMLLRQVFAGLSAYSLFIRLKNNVSQAISEINTLQIKISEIRTISQETQLTQEKWLRSVQKLSIKYAHSTGDITAGIYQTISNQIAKGEEAVKFMENALAFANVTGATSADSVGLLTTGLNAYSKSIAATEQVAASYYKTIELGRVRAEEMATTIGRTAPLASVLGVKLNELNAAVATMTIQGQPVNVSTTLLRGILLKLIKPTESMNKLFKEWGVESGENAVKTMGFVNVIRKLNDEVLRGGQARIGELFGRERPMTGMATLAKNNLHNYEQTLAKYATADKDYFNAKMIAVESDGFYMRQTWRELQVFYQKEFAEPIVKGTASFLRGFREYDKDLKVTVQLVKHVGLGMVVWYTLSRQIKAETAKQLALEQGIAVTKTRSLGTTSLMLGKVALITAALEGAMYIAKSYLSQMSSLEARYQAILGVAAKQEKAEDNLNLAHVKRLNLIKETYKTRSNAIIENYNLEINKIDKVTESLKLMYADTTFTAEDSVKRFFKVLNAGIARLKRDVTSLKAGIANVVKSSDSIRTRSQQREFETVAGAKSGKTTRHIEPIDTGLGPLESPYSRSRSQTRREDRISEAEPAMSLSSKKNAMMDMIKKQIDKVNKEFNKAIITGSAEGLKKAQVSLEIARKWINALKDVGVSKTRINQMQSSLDKAQLAAEAGYAKKARANVRAEEAKIKQLETDKANITVWMKQRKILAKRIAKAEPMSKSDLKARQAKLDANVKEKKDKLARDETQLKTDKQALDFLSDLEDKGRAPEGSTLEARVKYKKQQEVVSGSREALSSAEASAKAPYKSADEEKYKQLGSNITKSIGKFYGPVAVSTMSWQSKNGRIQAILSGMDLTNKAISLVSKGTKLDTSAIKTILETWETSTAKAAKAKSDIEQNEKLKKAEEDKRVEEQKKANKRKADDETDEKERFRLNKEKRAVKEKYDEQVAGMKKGLMPSTVGGLALWAAGGYGRTTEAIQGAKTPIATSKPGEADSWKTMRDMIKKIDVVYDTDTPGKRVPLIAQVVSEVAKNSVVSSREGAVSAYEGAQESRRQYQSLEIQLNELNEKRSADGAIPGGELPTVEQPKETKIELSFNDKKFVELFSAKIVEKINRDKRLAS